MEQVYSYLPFLVTSFLAAGLLVCSFKNYLKPREGTIYLVALALLQMAPFALIASFKPYSLEAVLPVGVASFIFMCLILLLPKNSSYVYYSAVYMFISALLIMLNTTGSLTSFAVALCALAPCIAMLISFRGSVNYSDYSPKHPFLAAAFISCGLMFLGVVMLVVSTNTDALFGVQNAKLLSNLVYKAGVLLFICSAMFWGNIFPFNLWINSVKNNNISSLFVICGALPAVLLITFGRLLNGYFIGGTADFNIVIAVFAFLSMTYSNIMILLTKNLKTFFIHSCINNLSWLFLVGALSHAELHYAYAFSFTWLIGSLGLCAAIKYAGEDNNITSLNSLFDNSPAAALAVAVCCLSLAALPFTAGFYPKFFILTSNAYEFKWIIYLLALNYAFAMLAYLRLIAASFTRTKKPLYKNLTSKAVLIIAAALLLIISLFPQHFMQICQGLIS